MFNSHDVMYIGVLVLTEGGNLFELEVNLFRIFIERTKENSFF